MQSEHITLAADRATSEPANVERVTLQSMFAKSTPASHRNEPGAGKGRKYCGFTVTFDNGCEDRGVIFGTPKFVREHAMNCMSLPNVRRVLAVDQHSRKVLYEATKLESSSEGRSNG